MLVNSTQLAWVALWWFLVSGLPHETQCWQGRCQGSQHSAAPHSQARSWTTDKASSSLAHITSGPKAWTQGGAALKFSAPLGGPLAPTPGQAATGQAALSLCRLFAASIPSLTSRAETPRGRGATSQEGRQQPQFPTDLPAPTSGDPCPQLCSCRKCLLPPPPPLSRTPHGALKSSLLRNLWGRP